MADNEVKTEEIKTEAESDKQNRFKSLTLWVSVLGAVWTIASALGLTAKLGIEESTFKTVVDTVGGLLVTFGILNNPTSKSSF